MEIKEERHRRQQKEKNKQGKREVDRKGMKGGGVPEAQPLPPDGQ